MLAVEQATVLSTHDGRLHIVRLRTIALKAAPDPRLTLDEDQPFEGAAETAMGRIDSITVDAEHPASLARFWAAALEGYAVRAYDEAEVARLAALGLTPETDPTVMVDGPGPTLCFQKMPGKTSGRNRWHIDLRGTSHQNEVDRLCKLGATVREVRHGWTTLLDPEGNPFCVLGDRAV